MGKIKEKRYQDKHYNTNPVFEWLKKPNRVNNTLLIINYLISNQELVNYGEYNGNFKMDDLEVKMTLAIRGTAYDVYFKGQWVLSFGYQKILEIGQYNYLGHDISYDSEVISRDDYGDFIKDIILSEANLPKWVKWVRKNIKKYEW